MCSIVRMIIACCVHVGSLPEHLFVWYVCGFLHQVTQGNHRQAHKL